VIDVDHDRATILKAIKTQVEHGLFPQETLYGDGKAGERIANLMAKVPLTFEKRLTY
jgi:UDP-N-acetylglucosamine 2-epimerase